MIWIFSLITAVIAYLLGSINSGIIISKLISGKDIRQSGSGNAGATNMLRTHGKKAGILTLLCDMLKGVIAVLVALLIGFIVKNNINPPDYLDTMESMITPTLFGKSITDFKGGKGIATSGAVVLMLNWKIGLVILVLALIIMAVTRYVSLGSVLSAAAYPVISCGYLLGTGEFVGNTSVAVAQMIFSVVLAFICIYKHKANIKRLLAGEESKLGQKKSDKEV